MMAGWRLADAITEGLRNTGRRSWPQIVLAALVLTGVGALGYSVVTGSLERERANVKNGAYVWTATAVDAEGQPGVLAGSRCSALAGNAAVAAAGSVSGARTPQVWTAFDGGPGLPSRRVSPDIAAVFGYDDLLIAPTAGTELVRLGLVSPGQRLEEQDSASSLVVGATLPIELPDSGLNSSILIPVSPLEMIEECHLRMTREGYHLGPDLLQAAYATPDLVVRPFRDTSLDLPPIQQYRTFAGAAPGLLAGLLLGLMLLGLSLARRGQLMIYRLVGTSRATLCLIATVDTACAVGVGAALAVPLTWWTGLALHGTGAPAQAGFTSALYVASATATSLAVYIPGVLLIVAGDPIAAQKTR